MKKTTTAVLLVGMLALSGCYTLRHQVGNGGGGAVAGTARQWYALWGLIPLNSVDGGKMAGGASDYTIQSQHTFVDILIGIVTQYVTINCQTVTVTK